MTGRLRVPLLGVMAGTAMADANITSTALVDASRGLGMSAALVPVAASAMSMCLAASVVSTGMIADRVGRRRLLLWALLAASAAEFLIAASAGPWMFILGRCLVGVCMGVTFSASFATVRVVATPARLGAALGLFGGVAGIMMMVASFLGGSLASVNWRVAFLVVPVVYLVCASLVPRLLPSEPPSGSGDVDVRGQVLLAVAVILPLLAISRMSTALASPITWSLALLGVLAFIGFVVVERRGDHPFFPVRILATRVFLAGVVLGLGFNLSSSIMMLQLATLWQYLLHLDTVVVSAAQLPGLGLGVIAAVIAGRRLSAGWSERRVGAIGYLLVIIGFLSLALYRSGASFWVFVPGLLLVGAGAQTLNVPFGSLIMRSAPEGYVGPVTGARTTIGQFAYALGMAGATVLVDRLTEGGLVWRLREAGAPPVDTGQALDAVSVYMRTGQVPGAAGLRAVLADAAASYAHAFSITMLVVAVVLAMLGVALLVLLRRGAAGDLAQR